MNGPFSRIRSMFRPWKIFLGTLILIGLLVFIDSRFRAASFDGYCPESTTCVAMIEDFPAFYAALPATDAVTRLTQELGKSVSDLEMLARKHLGVRPTPFRWRVWLGDQLTVATAPEGGGVCLKPGLLVRLADRVMRLAGKTDTSDGISTMGSLYFAWRDGFLIASPSRQYVESSIQDSARKLGRQSLTNEIRVHVFDPEPLAEFTLTPQDGLPISGWLTARITRRTAPLTLAEAWPTVPLVSFTASNWDDIRSISNAVYALVEDVRFAKSDTLDNALFYVKSSWPFEKAPIAWDAGTDECSCALLDIDTGALPPVPEMAMAFRSTTMAEGPHPLEWLASPDQAIPHEWNGRPGVMIPWMGEQLALCLAGYESNWLAASRETVMTSMMGNLHIDSKVDADAAVRIAWPEFTQRVEALAVQAAQFGVLPGMNKEDLETQIAPILRAIGTLGMFSMDIHAEADRVSFKGLAGQQAAGPKSKPSRQ